VDGWIGKVIGIWLEGIVKQQKAAENALRDEVVRLSANGPFSQ
jgi:hypothetical protein